MSKPWSKKTERQNKEYKTNTFTLIKKKKS